MKYTWGIREILEAITDDQARLALDLSLAPDLSYALIDAENLREHGCRLVELMEEFKKACTQQA